MLILLSPAKRLDLERAPVTGQTTRPELLYDAERLMKRCKRLRPRALRELMHISQSLAELNHARFQRMVVDGPPAEARQAVMAFDGDVYQGLGAASLSVGDLAWAQEHLAILSGLYGLLRPLDEMQPYRLEMGSKLRTRRGADLYSFWGARIAKAIDARVAGHADPTIVNLASNEYFKAVPRKALRAPVITPVFKELHDGELKVLSFHAKKARGQMARWILQQRVESAEALTSFDLERYEYQPELSAADEPVFTREFVSVAAAAL